MVKKSNKSANFSISRFVKPIIKRTQIFAANKKAHSVAEQFADAFKPHIAQSTQAKKQAYKIRYQIFCEELGYEPHNEQKLESDQFDDYSTHCLLTHNSSAQTAGTVRIVRPGNNEQLLPIQQFLSDTIYSEKIHPNDLKPHKICEISRLAVAPEFRRAWKKYSLNDNASKTHISAAELRCVPFIAVGLYLSVLSVALRKEINHCFVMVEPRLAKSMRYIGLPFERIGPVVHYNGKRAPYYIKTNRVPLKLKYGFSKLLRNIDGALFPED